MYLPYTELHIVTAQVPFIASECRECLLQENALYATKLPLNDFPAIDDFEVAFWRRVLSDDKEETLENKRKYPAYFFSPSLGFLAPFFYGDYLA